MRFKRKIDEYNKTFLNENTSNEAENASISLESILNGRVIYERSGADDTLFYIGSDDSSDKIMIKVLGFKLKGDVVDDIHSPSPTSPTNPIVEELPEESEEIDVSVDKDPAVIDAKLNAMKRIQDLLHKQKIDSNQNRAKALATASTHV